MLSAKPPDNPVLWLQLSQRHLTAKVVMATAKRCIESMTGRCHRKSCLQSPLATSGHRSQGFLPHCHKEKQSSRAPICWVSGSGIGYSLLYVSLLSRARLSGFFLAPETNNYTFWVQADDQASLYLSQSEDPKTKVFTSLLLSFFLSPVLHS